MKAICGKIIWASFSAFHTTQESRREVQPYVCESGAIITWDGRLDNREQLISLVGREHSSLPTDLEIVAAAFERWGTDSFAKLVGDWALSAWDPMDQSVLLAKDFSGIRHLYYAVEKDHVTWCTILAPLVLFADRSFLLDREYLAGCLFRFPAPHLTPYVEIKAVPPSSFVRIAKGIRQIRKYWDFDPGRTIHYCNDEEYEEHFRAAFSESVRRRLRSDTPILAELSGGLDSTSIVCSADVAINQGRTPTTRLDTISYYDDSEPNWNERPYFTKVEENRARVGCHIDLSLESLRLEFDNQRFAVTPNPDGWSSQAGDQFRACFDQGARTLLSGIGGDEVTAGVPTPLPELQDLIVKGQFRSLAHKLKLWSLNKRKPWFHLLFEAAKEFLPLDLFGAFQSSCPAHWIRSDFARHHRAAFSGYPSRLTLLGASPSFQRNLQTLDGLRRQLAFSELSSCPLYEKRYPYLDRSLLEFIYATPREQLIRPGQRRSLMRRALVDLVPDEILNRKRKAFVARSPRLAISNRLTDLLRMSQQMISGSVGIVDETSFHEALQNATQEEAPIVLLLRTLVVEGWLQKMRQTNVLCGLPAADTSMTRVPPLPMGTADRYADIPDRL